MTNNIQKAPDFSEAFCWRQVVQFCDSWRLMLLIYSRQSPNFFITCFMAAERFEAKMFAQRHVDSSVKWMKAK